VLTSRLVEQEFVAHLFAPLSGPEAAVAGAQIRGLWAACVAELGMTHPLPGTGLGTALPAGLSALPEWAPRAAGAAGAQGGLTAQPDQVQAGSTGEPLAGRATLAGEPLAGRAALVGEWLAGRAALPGEPPAGLPGEPPAGPPGGSRLAVTGLAEGVPAGLAALPWGALAGIQDPAASFRAVLRHESGLLNLSLAMSAPRSPSRRRRGVAAGTPPGWREFSRWWGQLTAGGITALLGAATLYLAKARDATGEDVAAGLPPRDDDAAQWWAHGSVAQGFPLWDVTPRGDLPDRRIVVLAAPGEDARLRGFTWSAGDTAWGAGDTNGDAGDFALPPMGRYLLHAALLRRLARVHGEARELIRVREKTIAEPDLLAAEGAAALATLHALEHDAEVARAEMARVVPVLLPADAALLGLFAPPDSRASPTSRPSLAARPTPDPLTPPGSQPGSVAPPGSVTSPGPSAHRGSAAQSDSVTSPALSAQPGSVASPAAGAPAAALGSRAEQRVGFGIDVVGYSKRSTPGQSAVQDRVAGMIARVLDGVGLALPDTDHQPAGDGIMVVLPGRIPAHQVLSGLLHGWQEQVVADNAGHPEDPIRLRLAASAGPFTPAELGFSGNTIIEIGRLLDSAVLRAAVVDNPEAPLVALVSDRLHSDVVGEGYPGLDPEEFADRPVQVKGYSRQAWLWLGGAEQVREAWPVLVRRAVFVLHGGDDRLRRAVFGLLRDLDLRPVDWAHLAARAGHESPDRGQLLQQAFATHQAAVVVIKVVDGKPQDLDLLVRAGMAVGRHPQRTVVLEIGGTEPVSGLEAIALDGSPSGFTALAERLGAAGCELALDDPDWQDPQRFTGLLG
jgi:hypothetical protein